MPAVPYRFSALSCRSGHRSEHDTQEVLVRGGITFQKFPVRDKEWYRSLWVGPIGPKDCVMLVIISYMSARK